MTTCHEGSGHTGKDRDLISDIEDTRGIYIGPNNDTESTESLDTTIPYGGSEANGHLSDLLPNSQTNLGILTREINSLWQWVEAREGKPVQGLDCIDWLEWELQNLSLMLGAQLISSPALAEPFGDLVHQYADTLCTMQKQMNLTNSLLQDIAIFN